MADRVVFITYFLLISSLCLVHDAFSQTEPTRHTAPYKPTKPVPGFNPDNHHHPQQQQHDNVNINNVSPYYDSYSEDSYSSDYDGYRPGDYQSNEQARLQSIPEQPTLPLATESEPGCGISHRYESSIPTGKMEDVNVIPLTAKDAQECVEKCCDMGPKQCQYIWVFKNSCFAVSCSVEVANLCEPQLVIDKDAALSSYYEIIHPFIHNLKSTFDDELEAASTALPTLNDGDSNTGVLDEETPTHQSFDETFNEGVERVEETTGTGLPTEPVEVTTTTATSDYTMMTQPITSGEIVSTETTVTPPTLDERPDHPLENLTIAIAGETKVTLPDNQVQLFASSWPNPPGVQYHWSRVFGQTEGTLDGLNDATVTLSDLLPGIYGLRVTALAPSGQFGEKYVNVTVHDRPRDNTPPRPIISPSSNYTVNLPQDTVIFDASQSQDDLGLENLQFLWQQMAGPLGTGVESHEALLTLSNPLPGKYRYKLTVTDSDGASAMAYVDLKVVPERDYPPRANAGSDVVLKSPNSDVVLNGNGSTDDKPGLVYLWELLTDQTGVDMEGTDSVSLHVSKLTVGVYHFKLTVTDSVGQIDYSEVTVDVLPEMNEPPVADAGGPYAVHYPDTTIVLDGSGSHDDYKKGMHYTWIQTSGPSDLVLSGTNTTRLSITGLHIDPAQGSPTTFTFNLTTQDYANLSSTDTAVLLYHKDPKILPYVSAGPDVTIILPQDTAVLNGSATHDDFGITSYQWSRSDRSPAAGIPLLGSDMKPILILSNLVNGTYNFTLHVINTQSESATDSMTLHVLANPNDHYIIQLHLDTAISNFTRADMKDLGKYLSLTLNDYTIQFQGVYERHPHTVVEFYAIDTDTNTYLNVSEAWRKLTENGQDYRILHYHIVHVEMKVCQLPCSRHGSCDQRTKRCRCDVFWMENPFTANSGRHESNCEWSVFYVVLIVIGVLVIIGVFLWLSCWCCLKKRKLSRTKRRIRYAIHDHSEEGESKRMLTTKGQQYIELKERLGQQHTSLMHSESETEEEVVFDSTKKRASSSPPLIKNNKLNSDRYGNNSSLVNTVIPK